MRWYIESLRAYAKFNGRSPRREFWYFVLFNTIISVLLVLADLLIVAPLTGLAPGWAGGAYLLGVLLPALALTLRRLHDTGRSGWWFLIAFAPFVGFFILFYFMLLDGEAGDNRYGANPKNGYA